jgi:glycosyltransferase involved in cell wall biosynthesis
MMRHADRRQFQFHFCTLSGLSGTLAEQIRVLGGRIHPLRLKRPGFARRFRALIHEHEYDVVHSHVHHASGYLLRLAADAGVSRRVAFFHSSGDRRRNGPCRRIYLAWMRHWISRYATHVLANSRATIRSVWGPNWSADPRFQVIYLGVSPSALKAAPDRRGVCREFGLPPDVPLYIHVGRLTEAKNHLRLLSIFAAVLERQTDARLLVVGRGDGTIRRRVTRRIADLGIGSRVTLCGERTDVPRLLASADLMIFPSLWEGLGLAVLEAGAVGTPVVASDLPCLSEIATELPDVQPLPLEADDREWARRIIETAGAGRPEHARPNARRRFSESPFHFSRTLQDMGRVWRGWK